MAIGQQGLQLTSSASILSFAKNTSAHHGSFFARIVESNAGHQALAVENLALRLQLSAFKRKRKRAVLTQGDRLFWVGISRLWNGWRDALVFVQPDTVGWWQRERFRKFWARLSQRERGRRGKPAIAGGIRGCGFRTKWGTDSDGKWGAVSNEVGRGFDGKWGTFGLAVVTVPHFLRNGAPSISERCPTSIGTGGQG